MSVLVKDMKMPERCLDCPLYDRYNYHCQMYAYGIPARYNRDGSIRPEWCELVELPEKHGRLIDADKIEWFQVSGNCSVGNKGFGKRTYVLIPVEHLNELHTVIEAEDEE